MTKRFTVVAAVVALVIVGLLLVFWPRSGQHAAQSIPVATLPHGITATGSGSFSGTVMDTTYALPTGATCTAHDATAFKSCLSSAAPGSTIVLDAGVTYSGNFVVPAKANPNHLWLYIQGSQYSQLPSPGKRVGPADSANMPQIVSPNASQALAFQPGASYIRVVGVELSSNSSYKPSGYTPGVFYGYYLVGVAGAWPWSQPMPQNIVLDRVYIHGDDTHDLQAGLSANFNYAALVDSYCSAIHMKGTDTTCFGSFATLGPFKIVNNYLEAAGENVIFGGSGGNANQGVPADIEMRDNYLFKPLSWIPRSIAPLNTMVVKNAFELKNAERVLFDHNTIENVWAAGQMGFAIVLTVRSSQSGDKAVVNDVTISNNALTNVVSMVNTLAADDQCHNGANYPNCANAGSQDRWFIYNNVGTAFNPNLAQGGGRNLALSVNGGYDRINQRPGTIRDVVFQHNTFVSNPAAPCWMSVYFGSNGQSLPFAVPLSDNLWILDNVLCKQPSGDFGYNGMRALTTYMPNPTTAPNDVSQRFVGNVMAAQGGKIWDFPPNNLPTNSPLVYDSRYILTSPTLTATAGPPSAAQAGWMGGVSGPATLVSIDISPSSAVILLTTSVQYTAVGRYSDQTTSDMTSSVVWSTSDPSIATISAGGLVSAKATGATTIGVTNGSLNASVTVSVTK